MRIRDLPTIFKRDDIRAYLAESWAMGWPMVIIMFFEFFISITDVYIAGRIGKEVQAAYGFVVQLYFIFAVVAAALNVGAVSTISQLYTSGDMAQYRRAVFSSIVFAAAAGVVFAVIGVIGAPYLVRALNMPAEVKEIAATLMQIYSLGLAFAYVLLNSNGILRSSREIVTSLKTMGFVCVLNVGLNFIFLYGTDLGFRGIAYSTVGAITIGAAINSLHIRRLVDGFRDYSWPLIKKIFLIGWPIGLLQVIWQLASTVLYLILSMLPENRIEVLAAFTNGMRIESAIFLPAFAFNFANAVVVGNLLGKKKYDDAFRNGLITAGLAVGVVTVLTAIVVLNATWIMPLLSSDRIVVAESKKYLYIAMLAEPFIAWGTVLMGGLNGAGDTKRVMLIVALSVWLVRIPLAYACVTLAGWGPMSVWWAMNASIVVQTIWVTKRYYSKKWLHRLRVAEVASV